jgi:NAD(P)-dependent dehydrogenase (short-subunit alcohol dehydrogenase family)
MSQSTTNDSVVVVTGATDGIGRETARELVRRGARVVVHGRKPDRIAETVAELESIAGRPQPPPVAGNFMSLADVRAIGADLSARPHPIHVLVNNAGVFMNERDLSADGFELTMAVNHYAPFLLTHLLLPSLRASGRPGAPARIVNVSSVAHLRGRIDLADLDFTRGFSGYGSYAASKLANVLFTVELARRLEGLGAPVVTNALHPGVVGTKLLREGFGTSGSESLEEGAATSVMLALDPAGAEVSGRYFAAQREARPAAAARDPDLLRRFYDESARRVGVEPLPEPSNS